MQFKESKKVKKKAYAYCKKDKNNNHGKNSLSVVSRKKLNRHFISYGLFFHLFSRPALQAVHPE